MILLYIYCNIDQVNSGSLSSDFIKLFVPIAGALFVAFIVYQINRHKELRRLRKQLKNEAAGICDRLKNIDYSIHMSHLSYCYFAALFKITAEKRHEEECIKFASRQNDFVDRYNEEDANLREKLAHICTYVNRKDRNRIINLLETFDNYVTSPKPHAFEANTEFGIHREMVVVRNQRHAILNKKNRIDSLFNLQLFLNPFFYKTHK